MIDVSRILCPVDFSDCSRRAVDYAIGMARWYGARLTVLHVAPVPVPSAAFATGAAVMMEPVVLSFVEHEKLRADLVAFANAKPGGDLAIEIEVLEGQASSEISARASALHADLIVVGTHGRSGFERLLLGSVAERLLRSAPCPVLTVPRALASQPIAPGLFRRILCPTDFSAAADTALRWATSLAQEANADLFLLHVCDDDAFPWKDGRHQGSLSEFQQEYERWCKVRLHDSIPPNVRTWCTIRELTAHGDAHTRILEAAVDHDCDLVVMGVAGQRGLSDRVFGSTTAHVIRSAVCPVLATRPRVETTAS